MRSAYILEPSISAESKRRRLAIFLRGSAAAQCGEALPHRRGLLIHTEAAPLGEAPPRRKKLIGGRKGPAFPHWGRQSRREPSRDSFSASPCPRLRVSASFFPACCLLPSAYCLLPSLLWRNPSRRRRQLLRPNQLPRPSPSPSPTPVTGLHQWGAVTLFHGLPSDRVHAIAQDADGAMWFGTEAGLAKFDGRRTQTVTDPELPGGRVLALQTDQDGSLWIGTDSGAARLANGKFEQIKDLAGKTINAIIAPERSHAIMAAEQGMVYDCHIDPVSSAPEVEGLSRREASDPGVKTKQLLATPLQSADVDHPGPLPLTSLTIAHDKLLVGSLSRGVLAIENGSARPLEMRPQAYFIRALETDLKGGLWVGSKSKKEESGFYESEDAARIAKVDSPTGPVTALRFGGHRRYVGGLRRARRFSFHESRRTSCASLSTARWAGCDRITSTQSLSIAKRWCGSAPIAACQSLRPERAASRTGRRQPAKQFRARASSNCGRAIARGHESRPLRL